MAQKRETVVVDELAAAVEAIVANSRKTSNLVSRFAVYNERLAARGGSLHVTSGWAEGLMAR